MTRRKFGESSSQRLTWRQVEENVYTIYIRVMCFCPASCGTRFCATFNKNYPNVEVVHMLVDAAATAMCLDPYQFRCDGNGKYVWRHPQ